MSEQEALAAGAAVALVRVLCSDEWAAARDAVADFWARRHPLRNDIRAELGEVRGQALAGEDRTRAGLEVEWRNRLARLLRDDPQAAPGLRELVDHTLTPLLPVGERIEFRTHVNVTDHGVAYTAHRDVRLNDEQQITEFTGGDSVMESLLFGRGPGRLLMVVGFGVWALSFLGFLMIGTGSDDFWRTSTTVGLLGGFFGGAATGLIGKAMADSAKPRSVYNWLVSAVLLAVLLAMGTSLLGH
ncbi:hypothetical protein [Actinomadura decatromicini]|uniref:Uncharacterized protein n=1 Tax=Actinomadura decatromicini TaxID=2604572 RepID=A0A5D3FUB0_9ACTN|nr:hypothetical protein [Actinomadura decatromicini]TYK52437.1 hypothetical protein FXF68_01240 [Actinomadura decatromicini]